jgi:transcriptional regulator with XRE-family HTH domain
MQTIGERLEEARKKKGLSLREAADATKIRGDYLQKFEGNQFDIGLTDIYARGFLRTYATYLKLPVDRLLADYAALGHGEAKPRPSNREVYGRMPLAAEPVGGAEATAAAAGPGATEPAPAPRAARHRTGSSLPTGPDPAVVFKYVKIGGIAVVAILVLLILKTVFSGGRPAEPQPRPTAVGGARPSTIGLVALRPVTVSVKVKNADDTEGTVLFSGAVVPGETKIVPRPSAIYIEANIPENLMIEVNGTRYPMGLGPGEKRGQLPAPPR